MNSTLKGLLKSKTFWFNAATAGLELTGALSSYIPPGTATTVVALINIGLRFVTNQSLADKAGN